MVMANRTYNGQTKGKLTLVAILGALPGLSDGEREQLRSALAMLKTMPEAASTARNTTTKGEPGNVAVVMRCLHDAMSAMQLDTYGDAILRRGLHMKTAVETCDGLMQFAREQLPGKRLRQQALITLGFRLLYDNVANMGVPVDGRVLMAHAKRIPAVFDMAFPGYAQMKMLHLALRAEKKEGV